MGNFPGVTPGRITHTPILRKEEVSEILAGYLEKGYIKAVPAVEEQQDGIVGPDLSLPSETRST